LRDLTEKFPTQPNCLLLISQTSYDVQA